MESTETTTPAITNEPQKPRPTRRAVVRLGAVAYLNMQPLIAGLEELAGEGLELRLGSPSQLAEWLERGEIDAGMVPVASIFAHPRWRVLPGAMIGARGPVLSVLMQGGAPLTSWRRLRPDSHSMNSNALAQVLLKRHFGMDIELGEPLPAEGWEPPAAPPAGEGYVLIGSRALRWRDARPDGCTVDMGQAWTEWTGLPLVCALWAVRPGAELGKWPERLEQVRRDNQTRIAQIAARWGDLEFDRLTPAEAERYLRENIDFECDEAARAGLERFYEEGRALGLFPDGWRWSSY